MALLNANELKQQASIIALLERLGFKPEKRSGKEYFFKSMLRENDKTPSFTVDDQIGAWYDHGTGKGGNIIDFGLAYWQGLSVREVVEKIQESPIAAMPVKTGRVRKQPRTMHYAVQGIKEIGTHPAITEYLKSRGIFDLARKAMKEIYYVVEDDKGERRSFYAAGWKNDNGCWEVRNKYFKGCLGRKGLTFIQGAPKYLVIFEGYINYLSWRSQHPDNNDSVLVLNSLSLLPEAIERAKAFTFIDLYLDRDFAGHTASKEFMRILPYAVDKSIIYKGHNDYNAMLTGGLFS